MKTPVFHILVLFAILISLMGSALIVTPAYAAGITVTTTSDEYNVGGDCSLREAITAANTNAPYGGCSVAAGADSITLPVGIYTLTISGAGEDANATGDLDITESLTINGPGNTIIQAGAMAGSGIDRVFQVIGAITVSISEITIANGKCTSCYGGGILNAGTLIITNSTFSGNSATLSGGGISNVGTLTITNSTFSDNSATYGGGIFNNGGTLTITNSTFSGNSIVGGLGGGINNTGGTLTITNSTFSGNTTDVDYAGAIFSDGTLHLKNTILANSGFSGDCYNSGTIATDVNNLIEINGYLGSNLCGSPALTSDPQLAPLADNGGPTQTFALPGSSPALGAGDNTICDDNPGPNNLDQRGVVRPQNGACDIGAYESNAQPGPTYVVNSSEDSTDGFCDALVAGITDCTLREAITYADSIGSADTITFADGLGTATILLQADLPAITDGSGLTVNGGDDITVDGNLSTYRPFLVSSGAVFTMLNLTVANGYSSGVGGGLRNDGGQVTIAHSTFFGNSADQGGGIYNNSSSILTVTRSSFIDNYASPGYGGAIFTNDATATIANSTFSNNLADNEGGGVDNFGTSTLTVTNSTFSGNQSPTSGNGGGIYNHGTLHLKNTLLANSISSGDCYNDGGTISTNTNNLIETNGAGANACGTPSVTADPNLGTITGSPAYFPFNALSTAFNAGDDATCLASPVSNTSQNGITRPQGGHCDIGSFELFIYKLFLPLVLR